MRVKVILLIIASISMALSFANNDESADTRTLFMHEDEEDRDLKGMSDLVKAKQGILKDIQEKRASEKHYSSGESHSSSNDEMMEEEGSEIDQEE